MPSAQAHKLKYTGIQEQEQHYISRAATQPYHNLDDKDHCFYLTDNKIKPLIYQSIYISNKFSKTLHIKLKT